MKPLQIIDLQRFIVGMTGFEPATPDPPDQCATGLRYIPNKPKSVCENEC